MALPLRRRISVRGVLGRRRDEDEEEEKTVVKSVPENTSNVPNVPRFSHHVEKSEKVATAISETSDVDISDLKRKLSSRKATPKSIIEDLEIIDESESEDIKEIQTKLDSEDGPIIEREKAVLRKKGTNPMVDLLEHMKIGTILVIIKEDKESWKVTQTDKFFTSLITPAMAGARLKGKSFWDAVSNPEYQQWSREWNQLTFSEKKKRAEKMGVTWEISKNPKIEAMNITKAVREHLGIEKYRDEYKSRAARANIKGH